MQHTTRSLAKEFKKGRSRICQLARTLSLGKIVSDDLTGATCRVFSEEDRTVLAEYFTSLRKPQPA